MGLYFRYIVVLIIASFSIYAQDTLVKNDSSKTVAKIIEIRPTEIKLKYFNYQDGPLITLSKKEVAYVIYSNGKSEFFEVHMPVEQDQEKAIQINTNANKKDTGIETTHIGDFIKFNIQTGIVVYNSFCNVPRKNDLQMTSSREYLKISEKQNVTFNIGFNFLFGKSPYVKHVIGANYLRTKAEYYYNHGSIGGSTFSRNKSVTDFINVTTGLRFTIFRKLHLEPLVSFNIVAYGLIRSSGTHTSVDPNTYVRTTTSFENTSTVPDVGNTVSFSPKMSYQIPIKNLKAEAFISYNLAFRYELPWYQFGFHIYPIRKFSPTIVKKKVNSNIGKEKIKLFDNKKLNIDAGIVLNNGFTNTDESVSGVKPSSPPKHKISPQIGINFYYGKNPYVKHLLFASVIGSKAELLTRTYSYTYETNSYYENIYTTTFQSKVCFFNIGTGIRLIALKHLNFDNAIGFNAPLYSKNEIQRDVTKNIYDKQTRALINSSSITTEQGSSSTYLIARSNWIFMAKVTYEFNINQNKFGIFCGWNYRWKNNGQWHLFGITYYPFKKLR